jgi:guanine deaminase
LLAEETLDGEWHLVACGDASVILAQYSIPEGAIETLSGVILPGLFDLHFHWVQDGVRLMPKDALLEWLRLYTFPAEAQFADADFAEAAAAVFWPRILSTGTIGGCCYSSIHKEALEAAFRHAGEHFLIGNVLMTMESPPALKQTDEAASKLVRELAARYSERYMASPRFAPTTGPEVMEAAGRAARRNGCFIQTHLAETPAEIAWVTEMYRGFPGFEDVASYTEIYERVGLLGPRTIMGHCLHLSPPEWECIKKTDTVIASCPTSNAPLPELGLGSGLFDFRTADEYGVRWGLATDIGGGPFLSMFDTMQSFVMQNEAAGVSEGTRVRALYRSTQASAEILEKGDEMGNFLPGKDLSYIHVGLGDTSETADAESILRAILALHSADREAYESCVERTVIQGETVFQAS